MKRISDACVQDIIDRAEIVDIVGDFVKLEHRGGRYWGLCPFHSERTPSFSVNQDKNFFFCFGCKKGGSPVNFLMEAEKLSYPEALEHIAHKYGIDIRYEQGSVDSAKDDSRGELLELNKRIAGAFNYVLLNSEEGARARLYLEKRALSRETLEKFQLGWAPEDPFWLGRFLKAKGYSSDFLSLTSLFSKKYPDFSFFHGRVIFPIMDPRGQVVAFGGRLLEGDGPKYLNSSESEIFQKGRNLFGYFQAVEEIKKTARAILCEGYMDVISLHQAGVCNAVAPLGTAFTEMQAKLLKRSATSVMLSFDTDSAGQQATDRAALICEKAELECSISQRGELKDPSEVLEKEGPGILKKMMENGINVMEYFLQKASGLDAGTISGKTEAIRSLFPYLEAIGSEVRRGLFLSQVAKRFAVDQHSIEKDLRAAQSGRPFERVKPSVISEEPAPNRDLYFMLGVAAHRERFVDVRVAVSLDDLEDGQAKGLYIALEESFRNDDASMDAFLSRIEDPRIRTMVMERMASGEFLLNEEKFIADGIKALRIRALERKNEDIKRSIALMTSDGACSESGLNDLMYEKMFLDTELARLKGDRE